MKKLLKHFSPITKYFSPVYFSLIVLPFLSILTFAQLNRVELEAAYTRTDIPIYNEKSEVENVNGFTVGANAKLFHFNKGSIRAKYQFGRKLEQEVYPHYFDGKMFTDLYRDVDTHSVGAELDYSIFFAALLYGFRKLHEDTPHQLIRNIQLGLKVPVTNHLSFKANVDYEQPFGTLPMGFVNPYNRSLQFGFVYGFGNTKSKSYLP